MDNVKDNPKKLTNSLTYLTKTQSGKVKSKAPEFF